MTLEDNIRLFLSDVREGIRQQQQEKGITASGASSDSLQIVTTESTGELLGSETFYYQVHGRGPGKMPPVKFMEDWVDIKIKQYNPWALAKNIAKNGTWVYRHPEDGLDINGIVQEKEKDFYERVKDSVATKIINSIFK